MDARKPAAVSDPRSSVGAAARQGDRSALAELGRKGGLKRAAGERRRKEAAMELVALATIEDRRRELGRAVAALQCSDVNEAQRVAALATAIKVMGDLDAYDPKEVEKLRAECDRLRRELASVQNAPTFACVVPAPIPLPVPAAERVDVEPAESETGSAPPGPSEESR